jgi:release factor glutamine methyltransferase
VTLAKHIPDLQLTAVDLSDTALETARLNAQHHTVTARIQFVKSDLLGAVHEKFDLICANLPYIPTATLKHLEVIRHEPRIALDGGPDGMILIGRLVQQLPKHLLPGGLALLEIEAGQGTSVPDLIHRHLPDWQIKLLTDYSGLPRLVQVKAPAK